MSSTEIRTSAGANKAFNGIPSIDTAKQEYEEEINFNTQENISNATSDENPEVSEETRILIVEKIKSELKKDKQNIKGEASVREPGAKVVNSLAELFGRGDKARLEKIDSAEEILKNCTTIEEVSALYQEVTNSVLDITECRKLESNQTFINNLNKDEQQAIINQLETEVEILEAELANAKNSNGWISGAWDAIKNITKLGASSNKAEKEITKLRKQIENLKNGEADLAQTYKNITGKDLSEEEYNAFLCGETSLKDSSIAGQKISKYAEGQKMATDVIADIAAGVVTAIAVLAAPVSGGASLLLAAGVGAGVKIALKGSDCIGNDKKYSVQDFGYDLMTGSINGFMAPVSSGLGAAAGTGIMKAAGMEALETTAKNGMKKIGIKIAAEATEMAVDGALSGATDATAQAIAEGRIKDIPKDMIEGLAEGALLSPTFGLSFKATAKTLKFAGKEIKDTISNKISKEAGQNIQESISDITAEALTNNGFAYEYTDMLISADSKTEMALGEVGEEIVKQEKKGMDDEIKKMNQENYTVFRQEVYEIMNSNSPLQALYEKVCHKANLQLEAATEKIMGENNYISNQNRKII